MIATSLPLLHPRSSHPHTPSSVSANSSPVLRPLASSMAKDSPCITPLSLSPSTLPIPLTRSYARAPPIRPYQNHSPIMTRQGSSGKGSGNAGDVVGDTKEFGDMVVHLVEERVRRLRSGDTGSGKGGVKSAAGSWEVERVELIVDIPVWSPGCFQDLSTLHALRDTTLAYTHNLLAYLLKTHSLPASYRLLARSAVPQSPNHPAPGWGCIRLSPYNKTTSPTPRRELKPAVRRSSLVHNERRGSRKSSGNGTSISPIRIRIRKEGQGEFDEALASDDEDDVVPVELKEGYRSSGGSDDEGEEECADVLVAKEVEKRGAKEGTAFLMTLFGQPALILT